MKKPRLTREERGKIEEGLSAGMTPYQIAQNLARPQRTILREIVARSIELNIGARGRVMNRCIHRYTCNYENKVCPTCLHKKRKPCKFCYQCNRHCAEFQEEICAKLKTPHVVCNGCKDRLQCVLRKRIYLAQKSQENYQLILSESRSGIKITEGELRKMNEKLMLIRTQKQAIYAIAKNNPDDFTVNVKTLYRYINAGLLQVKRFDLNPKLIFRKKGNKSVQHKVDTKCRIGRSYQDYLHFLSNNPAHPVTEIDTLEGHPGEKVLLTLMFMPYNFMVARLLEAKLSESVCRFFEDFYRGLVVQFGFSQAKYFYQELFGVCLGDNGTEFSNPTRIENPSHNEKLIHVFYCDPGCAWQKAHVEANHKFIRRYLPKGDSYMEAVSFESLTQEKVDLILSHINSYVRESIDGQSPYDLFVNKFGERLARLLGITKIPANDICFQPSLIGVEQKLKASLRKELEEVNTPQ